MCCFIKETSLLDPWAGLKTGFQQNTEIEGCHYQLKEV
jgi:hypothetical protein